LSVLTATEVLVNVGYSVAGAIVYAGAVRMHRRWAERKGAYTGHWRAELLDAQGAVEKVDRYTFRHSGEIVQGEIERMTPVAQAHRRWRLYGRVRGRDFFAIFWSTDPKVLSYGCWYLHQVSDFESEGNYLRLHEGRSGVAVRPIPLRMQKVRE
jgi:hypothetical protein